MNGKYSKIELGVQGGVTVLWFLDAQTCLDFKRADEELTTEKVKRKSKEKAGKTLQLLEIELGEGSLLKEEKEKIQEQLKNFRRLNRLGGFGKVGSIYGFGK